MVVATDSATRPPVQGNIMLAKLVSTAEGSLGAAVGFQPNGTKPSDHFCCKQLDWPPSQVILEEPLAVGTPIKLITIKTS